MSLGKLFLGALVLAFFFVGTHIRSVIFGNVDHFASLENLSLVGSVFASLPKQLTIPMLGNNSFLPISDISQDDATNWKSQLLLRHRPRLGVNTIEDAIFDVSF